MPHQHPNPPTLARISLIFFAITMAAVFAALILHETGLLTTWNIRPRAFLSVFVLALNPLGLLLAVTAIIKREQPTKFPRAACIGNACILLFYFWPDFWT